jgi:amino acid transporter
MFNKIKKFVLGKSLRSKQLGEQKFNVFWGLPILASDAISSVAYAGEEILYVLVPIIAMAAYVQMFYVSLAIVALLCILVFSYRQTIDAYPCGGGSYIVAHDNLGVIPGLTAAATLSIDYVLTVAVSACAGTAAITSALPSLLPHKILMTLFFIFILTIGNLRGLKDSSKMFGVPTYTFIVSMLIMIVYGVFKVKVMGFVPVDLVQMPEVTGDLTIFLILRAFAAGCTALTGVEAVSNGIPNFREPSQKNAKSVLVLLALVVLAIFSGTSYLATLYHAIPNPDQTVIAQIAMQVFGNGIFYYFMQFTTALILIMAANTAFNDFPLLLSLLAKDSYVPRQFAQRGGRLNYSNGIDFLALAAGILVVVFNGETHLLLPLYAVGVFASFTLSQTGMWLRWVKNKTPGWRYKAFVNGLGAVVTFITMIILGVTKFMTGAWIVCILVPIFIYGMLRIKVHYNIVAEQLRLPLPELADAISWREREINHVIVPVASINRASLKALLYAKEISKNQNIIAFHVAMNEQFAKELRDRWEDFQLGIPLVIYASPYRDSVKPLLEFIASQEYAAKKDDIITIVLPEVIVNKKWTNILHNQTSYFMRGELIHDPRIAIITVPFQLKK